MKQYDYHCFNCNQRLNVLGNVILYIERKNGQSGIVELNPTPGEYSFVTEPPMEFEDKEEIDFYCPACKASLISDKYPNFVMLKLRVNPVVDFDVLFSRVFGERKTYVMTEDMVEKYGENPEDLV